MVNNTLCYKKNVSTFFTVKKYYCAVGVSFKGEEVCGVYIDINKPFEIFEGEYIIKYI